MPPVAPSSSPSYILPDRGQICDDDPTGMFYKSDGEALKTCHWLKSRSNAVKLFYCDDSGSEASILCPETCGACTDDCEDNAEAVFQVNGEDYTCDWLAGMPPLWEFLCIPGESAFEQCKETCNSCVPYDADCNDSTTDSFFVNDSLESKTCIWLADESRSEYRRELCIPSNPAFHACPETCGKCYDNCFDGDTKFAYKDASNRDCGWLSIRTWEWGSACALSDISEICQETCNSCAEE